MDEILVEVLLIINNANYNTYYMKQIGASAFR